MIKLKDLLTLAGIDLVDFKLHCATGTNISPLEVFYDGAFKQFQEEQSKKNFECSQILSLIYLGNDRWLFAGVWAVDGVGPGDWKNEPCFKYKTRELPGLEHLTGKAIIEFKKKISCFLPAG
jgi:hypothetical protein